MRSVFQLAATYICCFVCNFAWDIRCEAQTSGASQPSLHLADRNVPHAQLVDVTEDGRLNFQTTDASVTYHLADVVRWGKERWAPAAHVVWLRDGSWLAGQLRWKTDQSLELISDWFETTEHRLEDIRGLILEPPLNAKGFAQLETRMREATGAADILWNDRGEQLSGLLTVTLRASADAASSPIAAWQLKPKGAAQAIAIDDANIQAIVFSPVLRPQIRQAAGATLIALRDGSRLNTASLERGSDGRVNVALASEQKLVTIDMSRQFVSAVTRLSGSPKSVTWVSAIEPARYRFMESGGLAWPLGRDANLFGAPLFVADESVEHGLVVHAPAQVAYRWDGRAA